MTFLRSDRLLCTTLSQHIIHICTSSSATTSLLFCVLQKPVQKELSAEALDALVPRHQPCCHHVSSTRHTLTAQYKQGSHLVPPPPPVAPWRCRGTYLSQAKPPPHVMFDRPGTLRKLQGVRQSFSHRSCSPFALQRYSRPLHPPTAATYRQHACLSQIVCKNLMPTHAHGISRIQAAQCMRHSSRESPYTTSVHPLQNSTRYLRSPR
jgi:hypothetical protein